MHLHNSVIVVGSGSVPFSSPVHHSRTFSEADAKPSNINVFGLFSEQCESRFYLISMACRS